MTLSEEQIYLLGFCLISGIGPARFKKIKKYFSSLQRAWQADAEAFKKAGLDENTINNIQIERKKINLEYFIQIIEKEDIFLLDQDHSQYPDRLKEIASAPFVLFCRGNLELLNAPQLAVVGARKPTDYGVMVIEKIIPPLTETGLVITSGLAMGIDTLAHQAALNNRQPTIAVLAQGINDNLLKQAGTSLAKKIIDEGLLVCEYPPDFTASKTTFPARNRIISGLSQGVLVIEANEKSGSLITANYALEQNRELFAVPGNIFSACSQGTNKLIAQGAIVVQSANDILLALNPSVDLSRPQKIQPNFADTMEKNIYALLSTEPTHIDYLARKLELKPNQIATKLSLMELSGLIKSVAGGKFVRAFL